MLCLGYLKYDHHDTCTSICDIRGFYNLQVVSYHLQVDMLLASFPYHQQQISN